MDSYQICVALDDRFGPKDVGVDVRTDQQHSLHKHKVRIGTSPHGGAALVLTFTAVDLWTAILTGMAVVRQSGYAPIAVQASATTVDLRPHARLMQPPTSRMASPMITVPRLVGGGYTIR